MTLSVAICILVSPELVQVYSSYAHQLLLYFAKKGTEIYGEEFPIYNINGLVYLRSEAVRFGGLDKCSAWVFESYVQKLKKRVHHGKAPIVQIDQTLHEDITADEEKQRQVMKPGAIKPPNNAFMLANGSLILVVGNSEDKLCCRLYHKCHAECIYSRPCNSTILGFCKFRKPNYTMKSLPTDTVMKRCMAYETDNYIVFLPLLHDLIVV